MYDKLQLGTHANVPNSVFIVGPCVRCTKEYKIFYPINKINKALMMHQEGKLIQECFPDLDADSREFLISGICPECWNIIFPSEEEDNSLAQYMDPDCLEEINVIEEFEEIDELSSDSFVGDDIYFLPTEIPTEPDPIQQLPEDLC